MQELRRFRASWDVGCLRGGAPSARMRHSGKRLASPSAKVRHSGKRLASPSAKVRHSGKSVLKISPFSHIVFLFVGASLPRVLHSGKGVFPEFLSSPSAMDY
jgi:hypothetical protein